MTVGTRYGTKLCETGTLRELRIAAIQLSGLRCKTSDVETGNDRGERGRGDDEDASLAMVAAAIHSCCHPIPARRAPVLVENLCHILILENYISTHHRYCHQIFICL